MREREDVLLVCMPFGGVFSPSIGLSLLKAGLAARGLPARVAYFSIPFAERVGQDFYHRLAVDGRPSLQCLAGEWIFSGALFGNGAGEKAYVDEILVGLAGIARDGEAPASPALVERVLRARREADTFIDACRDEVVRARPRVLGFGSTFQQHVASLALARRVKASLPETFVVLGGANCSDVMGAETLRQFPFVDAVVPGEADLVFPELVRRVLDGRPVSGQPGVLTRDRLEAATAAAPPLVADLDTLPYPDYGDYFRQFEASRYGAAWQPSLFLETSRGCWWGERSHCTFCGLDPRTMAFRSKSPQRALDELAWLVKRHPGCAVEVTDNILDWRYLETVVPRLAARPAPAGLFYEVKANLRKEHVRRLRKAGVLKIQPGIESFSDAVLKLARKGVSALQNIQLLKWCRELGVEPAWNLLWGFPGEPPGEYARMARLVPLLAHLPPPESWGALRLDRFSPLFEQAERHGLVEVRPLPAYRHVYPLPDEALARLACFFTYGYREPRDVPGYVRGLEKELRAWPRRFGRHDLFSVDRRGWLLVFDLRPAARALVTALRGVDRALYRACDAAGDAPRLAERVAAAGGGTVAPEEVERRIAPLVERGLVVRDGSRYLALAIPLGGKAPAAPAVRRFYALVRALGRKVPGGWVVPPSAPLGRGRRRASAEAAARRLSLGGRRAPRLSASQFSVDARGEVRIRRPAGSLTSRRASR